MSSFDSQGRFTAPVTVVDPSTMINNFTADGRFVQPVVLIDPATGLPYSPSADSRLHSSGGPTVRHVTNRTGIFNQISGSNTVSGWRCWQISYVPLTAIQIAIANWYVTTGVETNCGGAMTVPLYVEYPRGTWTPIFQGGAPMVVADGATGVTDLTPINIPAFTPFRIAGSFSMAGSGRVPSMGWSNACDRSGGDEYQVGAGSNGHEQDDTVLGSGLVSAVMPQAVMGLSDRNVWVGLGDSIIAGVNDTVFSPNGGRGLVGRALADLGPHVNYGCPGDQAVLYVAGHAKRLALMNLAGVNKGVLQLGTNDFFSAGRTAAQVAADRATIRGLMPGVSWYETTITPDTTTSDNWQTAAGQTVSGTSSNTNKVTFNDGLRNTPPAGTLGVIDVAGQVETSTTVERGIVVDGGVWAPGSTLNDGVHPNSRTLEQLKPMIAAALGVKQ